MPPSKRDRDKAAASAQPVDASPDATQDSAPVENHDKTDVQAALARETQDGKGEGEVPPSDFDSFATEGVEQEKELLSVEEVTEQVLAGKWGPNEEVAGERLRAAGYDLQAVAEEYKRRKDRGAPSAF